MQNDILLERAVSLADELAERADKNEYIQQVADAINSGNVKEVERLINVMKNEFRKEIYFEHPEEEIC